MKVVYVLLSLLLVLTITDAFIQYGRCFGSDLGTETMNESWSCKADGGAKCEREKTICGCDGESITVGGYIKYERVSSCFKFNT